jgi:hypothetical protein
MYDEGGQNWKYFLQANTSLQVNTAWQFNILLLIIPQIYLEFTLHFLMSTSAHLLIFNLILKHLFSCIHFRNYDFNLALILPEKGNDLISVYNLIASYNIIPQKLYSVIYVCPVLVLDDN